MEIMFLYGNNWGNIFEYSTKSSIFFIFVKLSKYYKKIYLNYTAKSSHYNDYLDLF